MVTGGANAKKLVTESMPKNQIGFQPFNKSLDKAV